VSVGMRKMSVVVGNVDALVRKLMAYPGCLDVVNA